MLCLIRTLILSTMVLALAAQPINVFSVKSEQPSHHLSKRSYSTPAMPYPRPWAEQATSQKTPNIPYPRPWAEQASTQNTPNMLSPRRWAEQAAPHHIPNMPYPRPWAKQASPNLAVPRQRVKRAESVPSHLAQSPGTPNMPYPRPWVENSESILTSTSAHLSTVPNMPYPRPWVKNSGSVPPRTLARSSITMNMPYPRPWVKNSESVASRPLAQDFSGSPLPERRSRMNGIQSSEVDRHYPESAAAKKKEPAQISNPRPWIEVSEMNAEM